MSELEQPDHYETLQVSPRADNETIHRVFRHLAKRFHPDNPESGDPERFRAVVAAFDILSVPERRAGYDAGYERAREARWRIFDQQTVVNDIASDRRIRSAILSLLYTARRNDVDRPGVGSMELERVLGCPEEHMKFHVWYLKENGWVQRLENGLLAITSAGVDVVLDSGGPNQTSLQLLAGGAAAATATMM